MKNSSILFKHIPAMRILVIATLLFFNSQLDLLYGQDAKLSVQGILKKASGEAVPDGSYSLTFRLYTSPTAPINQNIWMETQNAVDVVSGIYSTVLGNTEPLDVAFDTDYYLGVTVGSTEMTPRIELTSAPYALSIRGENNKFPSSGQVVADSIDVNGNVLTRMGAPGLNGINKNGYGFLGDKDSGMYSTAAGQVSLYVNKDEEVKVTPDSVRINGDISLQSGKTISYNGLDDWRLVETDYFQNDIEGWQAYDPCCGEILGWQNPNADASQPPVLAGSNANFEGRFIKPTDVGNNVNNVLKKSFNLGTAGNYSYIKVKFKYYYLNCWDGLNGDVDAGWAAVAKDVEGDQMRVGFYQRKSTFYGWGLDIDTPDFTNENNWFDTASYSCSESSENVEMTFHKCNNCSNIFWLFIGADLNTDGNDEEQFGVGMIEIWVK